MNVKEYRICVADDPRDLEQQVNSLLRQGWELGSQPMVPIVHHYWGWSCILKSSVSYSQALIRTQAETPSAAT